MVVTYLPLAVAAARRMGRAGRAAAAAGGLDRGPLVRRAGSAIAAARPGCSCPGVALSVIGMTAMAVTTCGPLVVIGAMVFGAGFGVLQNATLALMYARVPAAEYGTVSAIWNGAYDLGMGAGAIAVGALVAFTGFSAAFLVVAASMLPALALARREAQPDLVRSAEVDLVPVPATA